MAGGQNMQRHAHKHKSLQKDRNQVAFMHLKGVSLNKRRQRNAFSSMKINNGILIIYDSFKQINKSGYHWVIIIIIIIITI